MSDLSDIRDGIKAVINSQIAGLRVYSYPPANPVPPCLVIEAENPVGTIETIDGDTYEVTLELTLRLHHGAPEEGYRQLEEYQSPTGAKSIRAAIRTDPTLNSSAQAADVGWPTSFDREERSSQEYGCVFPIRVLFT
jgi:hypothetical protein